VDALCFGVGREVHASGPSRVSVKATIRINDDILPTPNVLPARCCHFFRRVRMMSTRQLTTPRGEPPRCFCKLGIYCCVTLLGEVDAVLDAGCRCRPIRASYSGLRFNNAVRSCPSDPYDRRRFLSVVKIWREGGRALAPPHSLMGAHTIGFLQYRSRQAGVHHLLHTIDIRVQKKRLPLSTGAVDESLPIIHPAPVQP
jgi:hypothetical protein